MPDVATIVRPMPSIAALTEAHDEMTRLIGAIQRAATPERRAVLALEAYNFQRTVYSPAIAQARRQAVRELRATGYSLKECAELLGVTDSRIAQITGG